MLLFPILVPSYEKRQPQGTQGRQPGLASGLRVVLAAYGILPSPDQLPGRTSGSGGLSNFRLQCIPRHVAISRFQSPNQGMMLLRHVCT